MTYNISETLGIEINDLEKRIEGRIRHIKKVAAVLHIDLGNDSASLDFIERYAQTILDDCREIRMMQFKKDFADELKFEYDYYNKKGED